MTLLVHWNKSPRDTEKATVELFEKLKAVRDAEVNGETIKFFQPLYDIQDVGTDDAGIYEMVIEGAFIFEKKEGKTLTWSCLLFNHSTGFVCPGSCRPE